jgi:hypothetical protein
MSGSIKETMMYTALGLGLTDALLLIGHADADVMYEPYRVTDMQKAVNFLKADQNSPLLRTMLEAYNAGSRDIWIYPVAPMSEYEPFTSLRLNVRSDWGNKNFYEKYYERLEIAYPQLLHRDDFKVVTAIEAPHYYTGYSSEDGVDFTSQLVNFCDLLYTNTGNVCLGVIGTRIDQISTSIIDDIATDQRLGQFVDNSKFVMVVLGESLNFIPQLTFSYPQSVSTQVAIMLSLLPMNKSVVGLKLPNAMSLSGRNLSDEEVALLASSKINPAVRSQRGKRGMLYQVNLLTDNTLATDGSNYWSMSSMKTVAQCINQVRHFGFQFIGQVRGFESLKQAVGNYLNLLAKKSMINGYSFNMKNNNMYTKAYIDIALQPIYSIKNIYFTVEIGPGQ